MPEPRFQELPGGHRVQIVPAEGLRAGDRLAYRGRGRGTVLWFPVAKVEPLGPKTVRVAIDDGDITNLGGYSWNSRRRTTAVAIAPRRVYLASVTVHDPMGSPYVFDEATRPDAAAAAAWLAETLEQAPERQQHRLSGYGHPGEWVTHDYALEDREFAYDEDAPQIEHVVFVADARRRDPDRRAWSMTAAAATAYDRPAVSGDQTFNAAAAVRALQDLEQHGGLINKGQLAERWGITTQFAGDLIRRPGFPKPLQKFGRTGLFLHAEVLAWQRLQLGRPGRGGPRQPGYAAAIAAEPQYDVAAAKRAAARLRRHGGLIDVAGAALRRGVSRQAVERQLAKPGSPPPRAQAYAALYLAAEVDAYFAAQDGPTNPG